MPIAAPSHKAIDSKPAKAWQTTKKTTTQRGYGWEWQKLRHQVIDRDKALCQVCLSNNRVTVFTEIDHIIPKAKGGTDDMGNLQCICKACHKHKTSSIDSKG